MIPIGTNLERRKLSVATLGLIGANILVFALELLLPEDTLKRTFTQFGFGPATRNPLAPFTALFLHGDLYHIAFNMLFLWIFGGPVEERIGSRELLKYYFGAGLFAGILSTGMELIARPGSSAPGIGASGAISGVMAIFLYRCFYAKMKMVIAPLLLPKQVNVPVVPLVLFWFFQDVVMGIFSLSVPTGIGHRAHVGGFAFGIAVGRIKRYGHEGQVEQLRARVHQKLAEGGGWKTAEKDLLKLLEKSPDDPEVHQDLARLYAQQGQAGLAERHYTTAVQRLFLRQPLDAAYIVIEHHDALTRPMQPPYLFKAAEALVKDMAYEDAHKVLLPLAGAANPAGQIAEKALALFIRLSRHLDRDDDAVRASRLFQAHFPSSRFRPEIDAVLSKKPGTLFPSPPAETNKQPAPAEGRSAAAKEADRLGAIDVVERVFADPAFWLILLALNLLRRSFFVASISAGLRRSMSSSPLSA